VKPLDERAQRVLARGPWTLPNFITLLRLAALPFFLYAISINRFGIALLLFVAAGVSDGIDGYLARRFDMKSALGAYLDPIADKLLLMSSYLFLSIPSFPAAVKVPVWLAFLVISRDVLLLTVALLLILSGSRRRFPPTWLGKVTTVTLIITVLFVLCANLWSWPRFVVLIAFGAAATVTMLSGFDYVYRVASTPADPGASSEPSDPAAGS
jgi:cardiolipin synthase